MIHFNTYVFFDLESTGLPKQENYETKITELSLVSVYWKHLSDKVPRVNNKLKLCFNPNRKISHIVNDITGLDNLLLAEQQAFSSNTWDLVRHFLNHLKKPICLVAHNGKNFDFPLLQEELIKVNKRLDDDIYCIDSYEALRFILSKPKASDNSNTVCPEFDDGLDEILNDKVTEILTTHPDYNCKQQILNERTPKRLVPYSQSLNYTRRTCARKLNFDKKYPTSYRLSELYKFLFESNVPVAHEAESDVKTLIMICGKLSKDFINYAENNAVIFNSINGWNRSTKIT